MKKGIGVLLILLLVFSVGAIAFAEGTENVPDWFNGMMDWRKDRVEDGVTEGVLSQDEADQYMEHFDEMEKYHEENGFPEEGGYGPGMGVRNKNRSNGQRGFGRGCGSWN